MRGCGIPRYLAFCVDGVSLGRRLGLRHLVEAAVGGARGPARLRATDRARVERILEFLVKTHAWRIKRRRRRKEVKKEEESETMTKRVSGQNTRMEYKKKKKKRSKKEESEKK